MSGEQSSTPKREQKPKTQEEMIISVATAVLEEKKKDKGVKVAAPEPFDGDRKETQRFLTEVEIYLRMHPTEYDTDEKKCLFFLSYLRGKDTQAWKQRNTDLIFDWKDGGEKLEWKNLKSAFKKHYLPIDIKADAQLRIEEMKMGERADNYVNEFRVLADESGYDDEALAHIFRKGLPFVLADKILNQPQGRPKDLNRWYEAAIRFDEQYKYAKAVQKPRRFQMANEKKKKFEKKEMTVNCMETGWLSEEDHREYMKDGRCFRCAKQGHLSRDCPMKNTEKVPEKAVKKTPREAYVKIQAMFKEYSHEEQKELLNIMEDEAKLDQNSMRIPLSYNVGSEKVGINGLLDSGAGGLFMAPETAKRLRLPRERLPENIQVFNVDRTPNKTAWITHSVTATYQFGTRSLTDTFLLSGLGKEDVILGLPWLQKYNLDVNWKSGEVLFRPKQYIRIPRRENIFNTETPEQIINRIDIRAKMSASQLMAHQVEQKEQTFETLVPDYLHGFKAQFEDKEAERFPISRHYDHAIDLKPEFVPKDCKLYSLTVPEQQELDKFLDENLRKGYIRKSKSPNASPFFFVGKKEKGKL
ncbi:hypothetical protein Moror_5858 [Moniliophthora roreri MCA 2997]|uniref:CCHC-type domain-containing protein n=1 Tax=Moniliophthora roreri (strain MCA 2997) TaxID=1381753 RepID=V2X052_MONRO|nr:hypothetical protein Moror_5858 [Moniliophthora roreri MCA 2997]